jgi:hypothetical protein
VGGCAVLRCLRFEDASVMIVKSNKALFRMCCVPVSGVVVAIEDAVRMSCIDAGRPGLGPCL